MKTVLVLLISSAIVAIKAQVSNRGTYTFEFRSGSNRRANDHNSKVSLQQQFYNGNGKTDRPLQKRPVGVPPYAVLMEPLVHYSQPDPLYVQEKQNISAVSYGTTNDLIKKTYVSDESKDRIVQSQASPKTGNVAPLDTETSATSSKSKWETSASNAKWISPDQIIHVRPYRRKPKPRPPPPEAPEPIIEIIIKESNISLPAPPPPPPPPPKKKEPVHVFFVKYSKDPNAGYGEEKLIYEPPIPAVTPPTNVEDPNEELQHQEHQEQYEAPYPESVTYGPPPPSTTLKAIIKPESEIYHGTGGLQITFGGPEGYDDAAGYPSTHHGDYHQPSDPRPAVVFPHKSSGISRASTDAQPTKRNPEPFEPATQTPQPTVARSTHAPFVSAQEFQRPTPIPTYQQAPQFPAQTFHKSLQNFNNHQQPTVNIPRPTQTYSTLPQSLVQSAPGHHHFGPSRSPPVQATAQSAQQYHTINDHHLRQSFQSSVRPTQPQQYHTINHQALQSSNFRTSSNRFPQPTVATPSSHFQRTQQRPFESRPQVNFLEQRPQQTHFANFQQQQTQFNHFAQQPNHQVRQQPNHQLRQQPITNQQFSLQQKPQQQSQNYHSDSEPEIIKSISPDISELAKAHKNSFQAPQPTFQQQQQQQKPAFLPTANPIIRFSTPRPHFHSSKPATTYKTTTTSKKYTQTTQPPVEYVTEDPKKLEEERRKKEERRKQNVAALPKEVPDDLREQLLSSGILSNADIQILDYDKIGDIPIENLPPEALANFRQVAAGSEPVPSVVRPDSIPEDAIPSASENREVVADFGRTSADQMEMKVVRFNPESKEGVSVASNYMKEDATQLDPVVLNDSKYNRYLPLKVAGAQFPVPDVPELRGRNVTSVVVLAPVDYEFLQRKDGYQDSISRSAGPVLEVQGVHFIAGDTLKTLVKVPTSENYRRWLDKENSTSVDKQSVVLLVLEPLNSTETKDIYMFDISTQKVSKLKGELSTTFVEVAESNSQNEDLEEISDSPSAPGGDFTITDTSGLAGNARRSRRKTAATAAAGASSSR